MISDKTRQVFGYILLLTMFFACTVNSPQKKQEEELRHIATEYFNTFAERQNWDKLLSFYNQDTLQFSDINLNLKNQNFQQFKDFYDWTKPNFRKLTTDQKHLVVDKLIIKNRTVIARGHFNNFYFNNELFDWGNRGNFVISLQFDENNKIIFQEDFIQYPVKFLSID